MSENIEISELQAVDFALGSFIAQAFTDAKPSAGPKEWREFLARPVKQKIYRSDHDNPADFIKALQGAGVSTPPLPLVYYFRKPGFTNTDNNKGAHGQSLMNALKFFDLATLPISLDYRLYLLAWDKPTLDKLSLAWYRHINTISSKFPVKYRIDSELFDVNCYVADNRNVTLSDSSQAYLDGRLYAVMTALTVQTQVIFGNAVPEPPEFVTVEVGLIHHRTERYPITVADGVATRFEFDTTERFGRPKHFRAKSVQVYMNRTLVGSDDGSESFEGSVTIGGGAYTLSGSVDYGNGIALPIISPPPPAGVEVSVKYSMEEGLVGVMTP